jgi:2-polyprenyl-3-methyl-5-hydroxy-6-metoxy-1,4-benzoquinol methylase
MFHGRGASAPRRPVFDSMLIFITPLRFTWIQNFMKKFQKVKICDVTGGRSLTQKMAQSAPNMILKSDFQISCCNARELV